MEIFLSVFFVVMMEILKLKMFRVFYFVIFTALATTITKAKNTDCFRSLSCAKTLFSSRQFSPFTFAEFLICLRVV